MNLMMSPPNQRRVAISGTGFIARGLYAHLQASSEFTVSGVQTRREQGTVTGIPESILVRHVDALLDGCDALVECSGDPIHATEVISRAIEFGIPVVTMNSEFQVTAGSYFVDKGIISEAQGDQPGSIAALHEEAVGMGFKPLVYGNIKGFLNHSPTLEEMTYWSNRQGISLDQVTSFTDGTKVQIEQALVANGLGTRIVRPGLLGPATQTLREGAMLLAMEAERIGAPVADYVLTPESPGGVFIVARHDDLQADALRYMKLGEGPYYLLIRPFHLCHLEVPHTLRRVLQKQGSLLDNCARPGISVAALAKRDLYPGERIERGIGSFDVRGECVSIAACEGHVPIGLVGKVTLRRRVKAGDVLVMDDVDVPESRALAAWLNIQQKVLSDTP